MEISQLNISVKDDLSKLPEKERIFFVQMLIVLTDINVFRKLLLYSIKLQKNEIKKTANFQITLNVMWSLVAKLFEGWKLIDVRRFDDKTKRKIGNFSDTWFPKKYFSQLTQEGKKSLRFLEDHFKDPDPMKKGGSSPLKQIRNKIANHYDKKVIKKYLQGTSLTEILLYLPKYQGENFSTANYLFLVGLINRNKKKDIWKTFGEDVDKLLKVSETFVILITDYLGIVFEQDLKSIKVKNMKMRDPKALDKMSLDFFSKSPNRKKK